MFIEGVIISVKFRTEGVPGSKPGLKCRPNPHGCSSVFYSNVLFSQKNE